MEKAKTRASRLSWTKEDFLAAKEEVPDILESNNKHTEGQLMSEGDIASFLKDSYSTFSIIRQADESKFLVLFNEYCDDIDYLVKLKKMTTEKAISLKNKDIYTF